LPAVFYPTTGCQEKRGETINGSAIGVLKGTIFFGFSDVVMGNAAPSSEALQSEAMTVIGRLP
jgi:hypothetical protein